MSQVLEPINLISKPFVEYFYTITENHFSNPSSVLFRNLSGLFYRRNIVMDKLIFYKNNTENIFEPKNYENFTRAKSEDQELPAWIILSIVIGTVLSFFIILIGVSFLLRLCWTKSGKSCIFQT
jgi:RsiW-degrading membrane proteinase PrsW (M82 family)